MTGLRRAFAIVLLAAVFVMEGFDINAMALAVPRLHEPLGLEPASFGLVLSALPIALGFGGALLAPLGDRFGRRPPIVIGCLAVGLFTLATATATSIPEFLAWRLLTGVGLGACLPNVSALSAELAPERLRATLMSIVSSGIPLGLAAAGLFAPEIVAAIGWHGLFVVPGIFAAALALLLFLVLGGGVSRPKSQPTQRDSKLPQLELVRLPWLFPFAVFAVMLTLNATNLYLLNSWIPTVLPQAGFSLDNAARVAGIVQLAGLAIGIGVSLLIDRRRPGPSLLATFALIALCFVVIGVSAPDHTRWTLLLMVGIGGTSAGGMVLPGMCAYLFPPRLLSSAIGMGVLIGRVGAFAGPLVGSAMLREQVSPQVFLAAAAVPATLCALFALAVPAALEVRKREAAPEVRV